MCVFITQGFISGSIPYVPFLTTLSNSTRQINLKLAQGSKEVTLTIDTEKKFSTSCECSEFLENLFKDSPINGESIDNKTYSFKLNGEYTPLCGNLALTAILDVYNLILSYESNNP